MFTKQTIAETPCSKQFQKVLKANKKSGTALELFMLLYKIKNKKMNKQITQKNFKKEVMQKTGLVVVEFYAEWSGTCQMMMPVYNQAAGSYSSAAGFYTVDVDSSPELKEQLGVTELPTHLFFRNGNMVDYVSVSVSKNAVRTKIKNIL